MQVQLGLWESGWEQFALLAGEKHSFTRWTWCIFRQMQISYSILEGIDIFQTDQKQNLRWLLSPPLSLFLRRQWNSCHSLSGFLLSLSVQKAMQVNQHSEQINGVNAPTNSNTATINIINHDSDVLHIFIVVFKRREELLMLTAKSKQCVYRWRSTLACTSWFNIFPQCVQFIYNTSSSSSGHKAVCMVCRKSLSLLKVAQRSLWFDMRGKKNTV